VTLGAMLAFMLATLMAALIGQLLGKSLPEKPLRLVAGGLFIVLGAWVIWTTLSGKAD
jgi:putative Ca2+/H+ antiporter (TMEM165/GDT1 family)